MQINLDNSLAFLYLPKIKENMKLKLTLFLAAIFFSLQTNAQSKVGTVDSEYILSKMPQMNTLEVRMKSYGAKLDSSFSIKVKQYDLKVDAYNKIEKTLSDADRKTKYQEIVTLDQDLNKFRQNGTKLMQIRRDELLRPLYKKISDVIKEVSKANGYTQILTLTGNQFAFFDEKFDITTLVMKKMGIKDDITNNK